MSELKRFCAERTQIKFIIYFWLCDRLYKSCNQKVLIVGYRAEETSSNKMNLCSAGFIPDSHWDHPEASRVVLPDNPVCLIGSCGFQEYRLGISL